MAVRPAMLCQLHMVTVMSRLPQRTQIPETHQELTVTIFLKTQKADSPLGAPDGLQGLSGGRMLQDQHDQSSVSDACVASVGWCARLSIVHDKIQAGTCNNHLKE